MYYEAYNNEEDARMHESRRKKRGQSRHQLMSRLENSFHRDESEA